MCSDEKKNGAVCGVCFRHCRIEEGGLGFCGARTCSGGKIVCASYGKATSLALDPIEKKPLRRFHPGSLILSVGSYGCNLRCPFCQNNEISWSDEAMRMARHAAGTDKGAGPEYISPEELAATAEYYVDRGNIGVAFTYNEPLIGYEYVRDAAKLVHEKSMKNVMVTNGTAELSVLSELSPYIDAMNIDLKSFTDRFYSSVLGGDRKMVMDFIAEAVKVCHVELTTLIIPGENDSEEEMDELSSWIASLDAAPEYYDSKAPEGSAGSLIPLHVTRFFPCFHMTDRGPTDVDLVKRLAAVAGKNLKYVYTGNI